MPHAHARRPHAHASPTPQNVPLFLRTFSDDDVLKLQLAVYSSLDVIEERTRSDLSLGLLCPVDELKV
jgi:hypothetical protein